ncbi:glycosyltransferase [Nakamurella sp.]|uniref:glycosyltransferase n=1 Tax=Nakamurella sp. TaxID=1869182 RepID=UPI003B3AC957
MLSVPGTGGTEMRLAEVVPPLARAGATTHLLPLGSEPGTGPLLDVGQEHGGTITPIPLDLRFPVRFLRLLRDMRPTVIHVDCANFSGIPLALAALADVPVRVAHFHGDDNLPRSHRRRATRWIGRRLLRWSATDIIGVSPSSLDHGFPTWRQDPRCQVVLNGLDLGRLLRPGPDDLRALIGAGDGDLVFLTVGRASPEKRRWLIPPILGELRDRGISAHAVLVGAGDDADDGRVRRAAESAGVADKVHLIGVRTDIGSLLGQVDAVIHPSCLEGLPGSVLEPVAVGVGTVATDLPGVRLIAGELPGVAIVPANAPAHQWADAALDAVRFTAAGDRQTAADRFRDSVFALDAVIDTHLAMYRRRPHRGRRPLRAAR